MIKSVSLALMIFTTASAFAQTESHSMTRNDALVGQVTALQAGQLDKAIRIGERALRHRLTTAVESLIQSNLCLAWQHQDEPNKALAHCDAALALDPGAWQALVNRGTIHYTQGSYEKAYEDFALADHVHPGNAAILQNMALARANLPRAVAAR